MTMETLSSHLRWPSIFERHGPNPSVNSKWHLTNWERLKLSFMSLMLFPLSSALILLSIACTVGGSRAAWPWAQTPTLTLFTTNRRQLPSNHHQLTSNHRRLPPTAVGLHSAVQS